MTLFAVSRRTQDGFSGTATRKPAATASSQLLSNPNIIPDQQTGLSVAIHNGQMWSHNQSFNNGAMPSAGMAPCNVSTPCSLIIGLASLERTLLTLNSSLERPV